MFVDLLVTVIGSTIIGWNVGSWLLPASWLAVLYLAAIIMKVRPPLAVFSQKLSTSGLRISESCFDTTTLRETEGFPDGDRV